MRGKIIKLSQRGWGFIISPEKRFTRIFFFWSGLKPQYDFESLKVGDEVKFDLIYKENRGWRAINIEVANDY